MDVNDGFLPGLIEGTSVDDASLENVGITSADNELVASNAAPADSPAIVKRRRDIPFESSLHRPVVVFSFVVGFTSSILFMFCPPRGKLPCLPAETAPSIHLSSGKRLLCAYPGEIATTHLCDLNRTREHNPLDKGLSRYFRLNLGRERSSSRH
jgi:hypothetical protein